jgi:ADP-ribosylglycohydrolase
MIGAICGDVIGSRFEWNNITEKYGRFKFFHNKCRFTDDSVLSIATAEAILFNRNYGEVYKEYFTRFPQAGYGKAFKKWGQSEIQEPYNSWGNGSAMRISPIAWAFDSEKKVLEEAEKSASVTHNHEEGIKGAQATALTIFMARKSFKKEIIKDRIEKKFGYNLKPEINGKFDVSCQGSVPHAIAAFLESNDFEDSIVNAIYRGGDSDTIASIAGAIAEAYYGIPYKMICGAFNELPEDLANMTELFVKTYIRSGFVKPPKRKYDWIRIFDVLSK